MRPAARCGFRSRRRLFKALAAVLAFDNKALRGDCANLTLSEVSQTFSSWRLLTNSSLPDQMRLPLTSEASCFSSSTLA
jgi:hypothetical protein